MKTEPLEISITLRIYPEDDMFIAECAEIPITSQGFSVEEAQRNFMEAFTLWLETASPEEISVNLPRLTCNEEAVFTTRVRVPYHGQVAGAVRH